MSRTLIVVLLVFLSGCASVPREEALKLSTAGQKAAEASQASLVDLANEVGGVTERNLVRFSVVKCKAQKSPSTPCEISTAPDESVTQNEKLAGVISLRARALMQLHSAYGAFADEAKYDAQGDIDESLGKLTDSVNALAAAMATLTGGSTAAVIPVMKIAQKAAGESAKAAQKRRLLEASQALQAIDRKLLELLREESAVYGNISDTLLSNRLQVADALLAAGILDPRPLVTDFAARNRMGALADIKANDPSVVAAARTIHAHQARRSAAATRAAYASNIKAFEELIEQHDAFQAGQPVSLDGIAQALGEIRLWAELLKELDDQGKEKQP